MIANDLLNRELSEPKAMIKIVNIVAILIIALVLS
jgi:hypothetical protein